MIYLFIGAYLLPAAIGLLRLWFDKVNQGFKHFITFGYWALVPIWNLVLLYFIILELNAKFKAKK